MCLSVLGDMGNTKNWLLSLSKFLYTKHIFIKKWNHKSWWCVNNSEMSGTTNYQLKIQLSYQLSEVFHDMCPNILWWPLPWHFSYYFIWLCPPDLPDNNIGPVTFEFQVNRYIFLVQVCLMQYLKHSKKNFHVYLKFRHTWTTGYVAHLLHPFTHQ